MSISERLYIRWLPAEPSEPTSTLVLTTPGRHFPSGTGAGQRARPRAAHVARMGFAGRAVGTPTHGRWIHDISSRPAHPDDGADEGDVAPHPTRPDVELERGRMRHPDSGAMTEYEEAWKAVSVLPLGGPRAREGRRVAVWLERQQGAADKKGTIVRVGQYCQGIVREGTEVAVQRWQWTEVEGAWQKVGQVGDLAIPCDAAWSEVKEGDVVQRGGSTWDVREVAVW
ncbi:hypothetical protein FKP32DRAFT_1668615 [Trametes sanguinea]|nr:hypothetical protein FKP32DRAFT_1668615 [Trametes sanguinea]